VKGTDISYETIVIIQARDHVPWLEETVRIEKNEVFY
jgi:hypothetical protein